MSVPPLLLLRAYAVLLIERLLPQLWPMLTGLLIFLGLAWINFFTWLPPLAHALMLAGFVTWLGMEIWIIHQYWRGPNLHDILRRIELASHLSHRPLSAANDKIFGPASAKTLWEWNKQRLRDQVAAWQAGLPRLSLAAEDPFALRALLVIFVVLAYVMADEEAVQRLQRAWLPPTPPASSLATSIAVWVVPPSYTKLPNIVLAPGKKTDGVIEIPAGSTLWAQVDGARHIPQIITDKKSQSLEALTQNNYQWHGDLPATATLQLRVGWQNLGSWPIKIISDLAPKIELLGKPRQTERANLRIDYKAEDDYGLEAITAEIGKPDEEEKIILNLPAPVKKSPAAAQTSFQDVAYHRWAGEEVRIRLIARDALNHVTATEFIPFILPKRQFDNSLARRLIGNREVLIDSPGKRNEVKNDLGAVLAEVKEIVGDVLATLGIRSSYGRLAFDPAVSAVDETVPLLWETALHIEDSGVSNAEAKLRRIEQALQEALAAGASPEAIEALLDQFDQALSEYLTNLAVESEKRGLFDLPPLDIEAPSLGVNELERLMQRLRQLAMTGDRGQAQDLLSKLQSMMANLRSKPNAPLTPEQKRAMAALQAIQNVLRQQQGALDESAAVRAQNPAAWPEASIGKAIRSQAEIKENLAKALKPLQELIPLPNSFTEADGDMKLAIQDFQKKQTAAAFSHQQGAAEKLRQALQELMQQSNSGAGGAMRAAGGKTDPLGRPIGGASSLDAQGIKIPEMQEMEKVQDVMDELHRRSGDVTRPSVEQDYIHRLLKRF
ncbi:MAG: DUF4175 domain-containing protein [Dongiaceae bacterium]